MAKMEHIAATDPDAVDPDVLAEQIALAERAAVLNRRAVAKQKLAEQNTASRERPRTADDPVARPDNLAMVTPLEFEQVPGVERPVMKRPATSYVPVVTNPGPRVDAPTEVRHAAPGHPRQAAAPAPRPAAPRVHRPCRGGRKGSVRTAAAPAGRTPPRRRRRRSISPGLAPVAANSAYGLDPLDAATAGLGRARRLRMLQLGVLALGIVALIAGITLIITGLAIRLGR